MKNIYRIIFWSFVLILCIAAGILGIMKNMEDLNKNKTKLYEIIDYFNNSLLIREYKARNVEIKANLSGNNIVVNYSGSQIKTYKFKLKDTYLKVQFEIDDNYGYVLTMLMADAISEYHGQTDEAIYTLFNNRNVFNYKLNEGIEITKEYNNYIVKLNLETPINAPEIVIEEENTLEDQ